MGERGPDGFGPAHVPSGGDGIESLELLGGQPDCHDLHRFRPTTGASAASTLELLDVVTLLCLIGPLLDLLFTRHP